MKFGKAGGETGKGIGRVAGIFYNKNHDGMRSRKVQELGQPVTESGRLLTQ